MQPTLLATFREKPSAAIGVGGPPVDTSILCEVLNVAVAAATAVEGDVVHVVCGPEVYGRMHQLVSLNAVAGGWEPARFHVGGMPVGLGIACGPRSVVYVSSGMLCPTLARPPSRIIIPYMALIDDAQYEECIIATGRVCTVFGLYHAGRQHLLPGSLLRNWPVLFGEKRTLEVPRD